jgi:hypothetical protein
MDRVRKKQPPKEPMELAPGDTLHINAGVQMAASSRGELVLDLMLDIPALENTVAQRVIVPCDASFDIAVSVLRAQGYEGIDALLAALKQRRRGG